MRAGAGLEREGNSRLRLANDVPRLVLPGPPPPARHALTDPGAAR